MKRPPTATGGVGTPSVTSEAAPSGVKVLSTSGIGRARERPQLDRDDVVEDPPAVREARRRRRRSARAGSGLVLGGIATFSRSMVGLVVPVKFWKPGTTPAGMPVSRIAARSARGFQLSGPARFGKTSG